MINVKNGYKTFKIKFYVPILKYVTLVVIRNKKITLNFLKLGKR